MAFACEACSTMQGACQPEEQSVDPGRPVGSPEAAIVPLFMRVQHVPLPVSTATSEPLMNFWRDANS